jgi:hypothetical protein
VQGSLIEIGAGRRSPGNHRRGWRDPRHSQFFELTLVLVHPDHVTSIIVIANHGIM